jgi:hypothetical protein
VGYFARTVALGADGLVVANHGGCQIEALPAPIDVLPAIVRRVGGPRHGADGFRHSAAAPTWCAPTRSAPRGEFSRRSPHAVFLHYN